MLKGGVAAKRFWLAERHAELERFGLERIGPPAGSLGRGEDVDYFLAARVQSSKRLLGEGRLSDERDSQLISSAKIPISYQIKTSGPRQKRIAGAATPLRPTEHFFE